MPGMLLVTPAKQAQQRFVRLRSQSVKLRLQNLCWFQLRWNLWQLDALLLIVGRFSAVPRSGSTRRSPSRNSAFGSCRDRASRRSSSFMSTPITRAPRATSSAARSPTPHPRSRMVWPWSEGRASKMVGQSRQPNCRLYSLERVMRSSAGDLIDPVDNGLLCKRVQRPLGLPTKNTCEARQRPSRAPVVLSAFAAEAGQALDLDSAKTCDTARPRERQTITLTTIPPSRPTR